jgi:hypothetical protein
MMFYSGESMKTTIEFLDAVKTRHGLTSDYQLSKHLDCTHSAISNYRMKKNFLDDSIACKVADDLGLESAYVLACIAAERAKKPEVKKAWTHAAEMLCGLAAVVAIVAIAPTLTMPGSDFSSIGVALATSSNPLYIM